SGFFFLTKFGDFFLTHNGYNRLTLTSTYNTQFIQLIRIALSQVVCNEVRHAIFTTLCQTIHTNHYSVSMRMRIAYMHPHR
ncbi:hypothetical protein, partial [uncultured Treponema sp.]|uniref:hypothetical protein n=1 Tax=uncultured Treponema sp. TaxID=162155 RepID=UPI0025E912B3